MDTNILPMSVDTVTLDAITPYPGNARRGDQAAIAQSLTTHGQYRPLVVQRSTGHVLCGNNTLAAAHHLGWDQVAVQYVDVDDVQAKKILLADNKTNDGADYDTEALASLLTDLDDLDGTGYDEDELDTLLADLTDTVTTPLDGPESDEEPPQPTAAPTGPAPAPEPSGGASEPTPDGDTDDTDDTDDGGPQGSPTPGPDGPTPAAPPPIAEMILAFTPEDRNEAAHLIAAARTALGEDTKTADIVLRALRTLVSATDARHAPDATITVAELLKAAS